MVAEGWLGSGSMSHADSRFGHGPKNLTIAVYHLLKGIKMIRRRLPGGREMPALLSAERHRGNGCEHMCDSVNKVEHTAKVTRREKISPAVGWHVHHLMHYLPHVPCLIACDLHHHFIIVRSAMGQQLRSAWAWLSAVRWCRSLIITA
jgi:hypothetical protein